MQLTERLGNKRRVAVVHAIKFFSRRIFSNLHSLLLLSVAYTGYSWWTELILTPSPF